MVALPTGIDGAQYSTPLSVTTSAAATASFGFKATNLYLRSSTSAGQFVDITGGQSAQLATTSVGFLIPANGSLGPIFASANSGGWTGLSAIAAAPTTLYIFAAR